MKKNVLSLFLILNFVLMANAEPLVIKLWENTPPVSNELVGPETDFGNGRIGNVTDPTITVFLPEKSLNTGKAIIICPGGGYARLAFEHEGTKFAEWLNKQGIAGIVLKYRMPNKVTNVPLYDVWQAFKLVHQNSMKWQIDTAKIGICGFSAGGHLASWASNNFESDRLRPAFCILFYPVISMRDEYTHRGSRTNLLGDKNTSQMQFLYSTNNMVNVNTPPTILLLSDDDKSLSAMNSVLYYHSLKNNNIPASMYIYPTGGHGWGMKQDFKYHEVMLTQLSSWLNEF